jgi:hypothetical protein
MSSRKSILILLSLVLLIAVSGLAQNPGPPPLTDEQTLLQTMHSIRSEALYDYVKELTSEKYGGRLTGTAEFNAAADWVISLLKKWGVQPGGDNGTYLQTFPNPYTLVFKGGECVLHIPVRDAKGDIGTVDKYYRFDDEFIPGGTSGSGEVTAEVIFVGYGITAPELGYDDYAGVDVKGKIVLMDPEDPVPPNDPSGAFPKWRPYSFHQYKLENAVAHGAKGMIYNYGPIGNPNNSYREGFIYHHVGAAVVADVFAGTGRTYADTVSAIKKELKPRSFATGKIMTIKNVTERHPEGIGANVIGVIPGTDPKLRDEVILVGGHLDHIGRMWDLMPGADDNATAVAVGLGTAEALAECPIKPKRTVVFMFFGSEEQGVAGSDYFVKHSTFPLDKILVFINMEGPGGGDKIYASGSKTYPAFWSFIEKANEKYIHRLISGGPAEYAARPRQDSARFFWAGVPSLTFGAYGHEVPYPTYHNTKDRIELIDSETMQDIAGLLFMAIEDIADEAAVNFRVKQ